MSIRIDRTVEIKRAESYLAVDVKKNNLLLLWHYTQRIVLGLGEVPFADVGGTLSFWHVLLERLGGDLQ